MNDYTQDINGNKKAWKQPTGHSNEMPGKLKQWVLVQHNKHIKTDLK